MKKTTVFLSLMSIIFFFSCKDDNNIDPIEGSVSSKDSFTVEEGVAGTEMVISNIAHLIQLAIDEENILKYNSTYPIITKEKQDPLQSGEYPMKLTIDFGEDTLECFDHRFRKGKISANISSHWKDSLSIIEAWTTNYYMATIVLLDATSSDKEFKTEFNSNMKLIIKNEGRTKRYDNTYYPTQKITIDSANIQTSLGGLMLSTQRHVFYKEGYDTPTYQDDKTLNLLYSSGDAYDLIGNKWIFSARNAESVNDGLPYFAFNRACNWLISGDIKLYSKNTKTNFEHTNIINFGKSDQSSCNNLASYSYNGLSIAISLP